MYEQMDFLQYVYGIPMDQADFMMNEAHEVQYNDTCLECSRSCKQSFRCQIIECPQFAKARGRRTKRVRREAALA